MRSLCFILFFIPYFVFGQSKKDDVQQVLNYLLSRDTIKTAVENFPFAIQPYHFNGDYSVKSVYPGKSETTLICSSPFVFASPIYLSLIELDPSYDSSYYQNEITKWPGTWNEQKLILSKRIHYVTTRFQKFFHKETHMISYPIFSKDGQTCFITLGSVNRRSIISKLQRVFILKKTDNIWLLARTIDGKKTW